MRRKIQGNVNGDSVKQWRIPENPYDIKKKFGSRTGIAKVFFSDRFN